MFTRWAMQRSDGHISYIPDRIEILFTSLCLTAPEFSSGCLDRGGPM